MALILLNQFELIQLRTEVLDKVIDRSVHSNEQVSFGNAYFKLMSEM